MIRLIALACGLAAGAYSLSAAFRSGLAMATGTDAYVIGIAFLGLVGTSWVTGPAASKALQDRAWFRGLGYGALWVFTTLVVLANSTGYIATHRGDAVGDKQAKIERYEQAKADLAGLNADYQAAVAGGAVKRSVKLRQAIQDAEAKMEAGRPGTTDAQAETLSWITGYATATVARALPVWVTVALDLASNGCFLIALSGAKRPEAPQRKPKRQSKRFSRRRSPPAPAVEKRVPVGTIDLDEKRAQRAVAHWAPR